MTELKQGDGAKSSQQDLLNGSKAITPHMKHSKINQGCTQQSPSLLNYMFHLSKTTIDNEAYISK